MLLAHARNDADHRLIEFGYDPWLAEWFLSLTPAQRLAKPNALARLAVKRRRELGLT